MTGIPLPWTLIAMNYVYIEQLGCAKNQVDGEVMLQHLRDTGQWELCEDPSRAHLILVNTCGFIESAREESINVLLELRSSYPDAKVVMTGCLSERYAELIAEDLLEADGFFGNRDLSLITDIASQVLSNHRAVALPREYREPLVDREHSFSFPGSTYLKLSEGCSHRCRYCSIPLIRGDLRSRTSDDVLSEFRMLRSRGMEEINLVAQDLAAFGTDRGSSEFLDLLKRMTDEEGDFWIRLLYIHPDHFPRELLDLAAADERILPYFDIPFQHGAEKVLRSMGRRGDAESYLGLIDEIRGRVSDSVIRSTFMLAFPGEGNREFSQLLDFVSRAKLDWAGMFVYSREEGTPAYEDRQQAAHNRAVRRGEERKQKLQLLQQGITEGQLERWIGRDMDVLIEEPITGEDLAIGRSFLQAPEVDGSTVVRAEGMEAGARHRCRIIRRNGIDLEAVLVEGEDG